MWKLRVLLLAAILGTTSFGALIVSVGSYWGGLGGSFWAAVAVTAITAVAVALWLGRFLERGLAVIDRLIESGDAEDEVTAEISEIEQLAAKVRAHSKRLARMLGQARQQSREVAGLLAHMNRRSVQGRTGGDQSSPANQLRQLLASLATTAATDLQQVLACCGDIERRTREIGVGVGEQGNAVSQTTSFVEQMSANIDSVSQNAEAAHQAAVAARESAAVGLNLVRELIRGMDRIRLHVEAGGKKLRNLGDRSHEIGSIVQTIGSISARTDLLALNASIESVRAGEHGRGFAVVAEEVRKLAEQTAQATREVTSLIESIQMESQDSIAAMADEHAQVEAEVRRVNDAGTALERISQTSSDSAQRVGEISTATMQQLRVTQKVVTAMQRISEIARGMRLQTDDVCNSTMKLTQLVTQLGHSMSPLRRCGAEPAPLDSHSSALDDALWRENLQRSATEPAASLAANANRPEESSENLALVGAEMECETA